MALRAQGSYWGFGPGLKGFGALWLYDFRAWCNLVGGRLDPPHPEIGLEP